MIGFFAHEIVRSVAALALHARVEGRLFRRGLVASAARRRPRELMVERRMRVVATDARPRDAVLGVVGLLRGVATRAGLLGAAAHVVGLVAARAISVRRDLRLAQDQHAFVAGAARLGLGLAEVVGAVASHAL
jgi:hypothetical protein